MKKWLVIMLLTAGLVGGCATLDAMRTELGFNHKTGQLDADVKGAGEGGQYHENTGLNLTSGDNTWPALALVGFLGLSIIFAYPLQRALRLRKEGKYREWLEREKGTVSEE